VTPLKRKGRLSDLTKQRRMNRDSWIKESLSVGFIIKNTEKTAIRQDRGGRYKNVETPGKKTEAGERRCEKSVGGKFAFN